MTAEFESLAELLLVILTILCILQLFLVGLILWYVKRMKNSLGSAGAAVLPPPAPPAAAAAPGPGAMAEGAKRPAPSPPARVTRTTTVAMAAPSGDVLGESTDIQGSILRLCEKYGLSDFIIATMDGLLVVSLSPGASEEAARCSDLYRRRKKPDTPGVTFLEIDHHGETMLGITRADRPLTPDQAGGIGEDARKILDWWL
jgi:hypothetical protein